LPAASVYSDELLRARLWAHGAISAQELVCPTRLASAPGDGLVNPDDLDSFCGRMFEHLSDNPRTFKTLSSPSVLSVEAHPAVFELDMGVGMKWFSGRGSFKDFKTLEIPIQELIAGHDPPGRNFDFHDGSQSRFEPNLRIGAGCEAADFFKARTETEIALVRDLGLDELEILSTGVRSWRGGTFVFEEASFSFRHGPVAVWFGRERTNWRLWASPGLLFSGYALPSDGFGLDIDGGKISFRSESISLRSQSVSKRLSAHQLRFAPLDWLLISTAEAVVYEGDFLLSYANPFTIYYAVQHNERESDNILWHSEIALRVVDGVVLSAEVLVDDYQYDRTGQDDLAVSSGIWLQAGDVDISGRYVHTSPQVYTHTDPELDFFSGNDPLGFLFSPDSDFLSANTTFHFHSCLYAWTEMFYLRRGSFDGSPSLEGGGLEVGVRMFDIGRFDFSLSGIHMNLSRDHYTAVFGELALELPGVF
jgi:hypothetical protein